MGVESYLRGARSWGQKRDREGVVTVPPPSWGVPHVPHCMGRLTNPDQAERHVVKTPLTPSNEVNTREALRKFLCRGHELAVVTTAGGRCQTPQRA